MVLEFLKNILDKLFDRFYKVNDRSTPDYRGSGLGLSIAQACSGARRNH
jgi:signal transduction histidine kinase